MLFHYGADGITGFTYCLSDDVVQNYFYRKNAQGDITGIYDNNNNLLCQYVYDAWGNHQIIVDTNNANAVFIANLNPFRYRGYYYDVETGLYYLNSRYYDPETGRFINADDITNLDTENLNGLNLYNYCGNNPIMNIDTNGNAWWNPFSWNWKEIGEKIVTIIAVTASVAAVAGGVALTIVSGGALANVGSALIGAGVGSILGGIQNQVSGGSFWGGYLGGAISGGITGLGVALGNPFLGGVIGNFAGTMVTDIIDNKINFTEASYWINLARNSIFAGLVSYGSLALGKAANILKLSGQINKYVFITVASEFIFSNIFDNVKKAWNKIVDNLRKVLVY